MLVLQYPIGIDRKRVWNRIDRKQARERSLKAPIAILQPRRFPGSRLAPPAADLKLLRDPPDLRQRLPARSAPRRPEVDQHHLACISSSDIRWPSSVVTANAGAILARASSGLSV